MLVSGLSPEVKEAVSNSMILKHDVVHVSVFLSVQRDGTGLAFGADTIWPWEVSLTP